MIQVEAKAPTRIDLAGGTLDLWPIHHLLDHKATINAAVTLYAQVTVQSSNDGLYHFSSQDQELSFSGDYSAACDSHSLPLFGLLLKGLWQESFEPVSIKTAAKSPAGAGLGGSSCLGIALAGALLAARKAIGAPKEVDDDGLVRLVQDVESRLIKAPTGCQDYWGGLRGGINVIRFPFGETQVKTFQKEQLEELDKQLMIVYSGRSRASAINNWEIYKRIFDGDEKLLSKFNQIGLAAERLGDAVEAGDFSRVIALSSEEWQLRTELWPKIETDETRTIASAAKKAGAKLCRVCGAGGGGVLAVFASEQQRDAVQKAVTKAGGVVLPGNLAEQGLVVS
jgi:D-glycero-alpha-D-manno-heptose-7-phosphate kinase